MLNDEIIDQAVAAFSLGTVHAGGKVETRSYMTFGDVNEDEFEGDLYNFPLFDKRYWAP